MFVQTAMSSNKLPTATLYDPHWSFYIATFICSWTQHLSDVICPGRCRLHMPWICCALGENQKNICHNDFYHPNTAQHNGIIWHYSFQALSLAW